MARNKSEKETVLCPVGRFFHDLESARSARKSRFLEHMDRSRLEFLKAIRSLLDDRIEHIEKAGRGKGRKRATRIDVE